MKEKKVHLPEVVLSHKMRDFEARTNSNSLLVDPLDNSLNKLTIEEKERVMARMQEKIQQITKDIDDNFLKIKDELDANVRFVCAFVHVIRIALIDAPSAFSCLPVGYFRFFGKLPASTSDLPRRAAKALQTGETARRSYPRSGGK